MGHHAGYPTVAAVAPFSSEFHRRAKPRTALNPSWFGAGVWVRLLFPLRVKILDVKISEISSSSFKNQAASLGLAKFTATQ